MSDEVLFTVDGRDVVARPGATILEACDAEGIWIPRLCSMKGLSPWGSCRICTVRIGGRFAAACTTPAGPGLVVENDTDELRAMRRDLVDMLFVEGNHFCMSCEKSGGCELQALAYRLGIMSPRFPMSFPKREADDSHPDVRLDRDRCILCARCVRASREIDGKHVVGYVGRGAAKRLAADGPDLAASGIEADDAAVAACPTGSLTRKRVGFRVPIGERRFDRAPIGTIADPGDGSGNGRR
jgi:[NiFe] hydrogenase diaphorase moiety small subunit